VTTGVPGSLVGVVPNHVDAQGGPVLARVIDCSKMVGAIIPGVLPHRVLGT
jgi:hypothetical protein